MKALFQHSPSASWRLVLAVIISIALMYVDQRFHHLEAMRSTLSWLIAPVQYLVDAPVSAGRYAGDWLTRHNRLLEENARLRDEQLVLRAHLQKYQTLVRENSRLRELLGSASKIGEDVVVAELLSVDLDPTKRLITINKGYEHGLRNGHAIIDADGVMGQILHAGPLTSSAMLITDPSHAIPVQINRTGLRTVAFGSTNPSELVLQPIAATADVKVGDLLVTSGLGGRFPPDYPVARISKVNRLPGKGFVEVVATPVAQLYRSREVLVIRQHDDESSRSETARAER
jgi:rod shape-determining protein MreC